MKTKSFLDLKVGNLVLSTSKFNKNRTIGFVSFVDNDQVQIKWSVEGARLSWWARNDEFLCWYDLSVIE